jgi:hypothetical protein
VDRTGTEISGRRALGRLGSASQRRSGFAIVLTRFHLPRNSEGVQNQMVCQRKFRWVHDNLVCVLDGRVAREAPAFMGKQVATMFTSGLRAIQVAVVPCRGARVGHLSSSDP